jgi:hypothetical protein
MGDDRDILTILRADFCDHMAEHLISGFAMVRVLAASPKHCINHLTPPG